MSTKRIAVIGGSLVGPAVARMLDGAGTVTVYEALRRPHSQSGGVMGLRPETLDVLRGIGIQPSALAALGNEAVSAYDVMGDGRTVYRGQSMFPGVTTSWDLTYRALNTDAPVRYGQRLTSIKADGGRYLLSFASGLEDEAEHVIFADGRKSDGRVMLDRARPLQYNGYVVWRGLGRPEGVAPRGFERYYDAAAGRLFSVTGPLVQSGRSYWELSHNLTAQEWARVTRGRGPTDLAYLLPGQVNDDVRDIVSRASDRLPQAFRDMIARSDIAGIPVNDVQMPSQATFTTERGASATLLGDALIPVRLQVGAGLNQGLAQASELAQALKSSDTRTALQRWQSRVIERLAPIVELGRSRAHRINLGTYMPVRQGFTAVPFGGDPFAMPQWVTA